jgi:hypothetical protein
MSRVQVQKQKEASVHLAPVRILRMNPSCLSKLHSAMSNRTGDLPRPACWPVVTVCWCHIPRLDFILTTITFQLQYDYGSNGCLGAKPNGQGVLNLK